MKQNELVPALGSKRKRKRIGRGPGSGHGTYSGRGIKGQKARSGGKTHPGFEGGQLPLVRRLPRKRGFTNIFKKQYNIINVEDLNIFEPETEVYPQQLVEVGLVGSLKKPTKILGDGELDRALVVKANKFSVSAREKIEAAGGKTGEL